MENNLNKPYLTLEFNNNARFIESSLSDLAHNLAEEIH